MTQETLDFVKEKTVALIAAHSCSAEAKAAAEKWLAAVGTAKEAEVTKAYIAELESDIMPIDGLIAFAGSEAGVGVFGAELAKIFWHMLRKSRLPGLPIAIARPALPAKQFWIKRLSCCN